MPQKTAKEERLVKRMEYAEARQRLEKQGIHVERLCQHALRITVQGKDGPVVISAYRDAAPGDGWITINDIDVVPGECAQ